MIIAKLSSLYQSNNLAAYSNYLENFVSKQYTNGGACHLCSLIITPDWLFLSSLPCIQLQKEIQMVFTQIKHDHVITSLHSQQNYSINVILTQFTFDINIHTVQ